MGVKGFTKWLKSRYPSAFSPLSPRRKDFDELYVDLNPLLHTMARTAWSEGELLTRVRHHLRNIISAFQPARKLFLTIDGPASLGKLDEQRRRRINSRRASEQSGTFDAQQFSPGCTFMTRLEINLQRLLEKTVLEVPLSSRPHYKAIISGASTPGEGEHKIFEQVQVSMKEGHSVRRGIMAVDSDVYLQSIGHICLNTHIISPPWERGSQQDDFNMDKMMELLRNEAPNRSNLQRHLDFVLFATLSGNDVLPGLQFGGYRILWEFYCKRLDTLRPIFNDVKGQMDVVALRDFMKDYYETDFPIFHQGLQSVVLEAANRNPEVAHKRLVSYLRSVSASLRQMAGQNNSQSQFEYMEDCGPSVGELALMDAHRVKAELEIEIPITENNFLLPGAAAIMMLDLHGNSQRHLPTAMIPIAKEFQAQRDRLLSDREATKWLRDRINALSMRDLSKEDQLTIFCRQPWVLSYNNSRWQVRQQEQEQQRIVASLPNATPRKPVLACIS